MTEPSAVLVVDDDPAAVGVEARDGLLHVVDRPHPVDEAAVEVEGEADRIVRRR